MIKESNLGFIKRVLFTRKNTLNQKLWLIYSSSYRNAPRNGVFMELYGWVGDLWWKICFEKDGWIGQEND